MLVIAALTGLYTILGGLTAVVVTESIQTIVLLAGAITITVFAWVRVGGWEGIVANVPAEHLTLLRARRRSRRPAVVLVRAGLSRHRHLVLVHRSNHRAARARRRATRTMRAPGRSSPDFSRSCRCSFLCCPASCALRSSSKGALPAEGVRNSARRLRLPHSRTAARRAEGTDGRRAAWRRSCRPCPAPSTRSARS